MQITRQTSSWNTATLPGSGNRVLREALRMGEGISDRTPSRRDLCLELIRQVQKLKAIENRVIAHERAHQTAGGLYVGAAARYIYQRGPDNRRYVVGGEVSIDTSEESNPAATIRKMEKVQRAALAPVDPSPQDLAVAAQATLSIARAPQELNRQKIREQESGKYTAGIPGGLE
ncbi:MAG TPA: putative metalloprotease CJM1_0395 family protein [Atribacteraceae bacterium]|nr:putative metalloprotease CJM1_0395 family protein [Atribacteraceae bacterium]